MRWMGGLVVIGILGCGGLASDPARQMEGTWVDGGGATYTFDGNGSCLRAVDHDGEIFTVTEPGPIGGLVQWTYQVPSSGFIVTHTLESIDGDGMVAVWVNSSGATGDENFTRQR